VRNSFAKWVLTGILLVSALAGGNVIARDRSSAYAIDQVALSQLPLQARSTHQLILQGGPFPFEKDGMVFGNRERLLPLQPRGFYREYTVSAPGSHARGVKRIICGGPATRPEACFYTADHYASFRKIEP